MLHMGTTLDTCALLTDAQQPTYENTTTLGFSTLLCIISQENTTKPIILGSERMATTV